MCTIFNSSKTLNTVFTTLKLISSYRLYRDWSNYQDYLVFEGPAPHAQGFVTHYLVPSSWCCYRKEQIKVLIIQMSKLENAKGQ